jgi:hypothetical protein
MRLLDHLWIELARIELRYDLSRLDKPIIPFSSGTAEAFRVERIARLDQPAFSLLHHN